MFYLEFVCLLFLLLCIMAVIRCPIWKSKSVDAGFLFNLPHHIGMAWEEVAFDDAVNYTQWGNG